MRYLQEAKFAQIVSHARTTNPFYARTIPENGPVPIVTRMIFKEHNFEILNGHEPNMHTSGATATHVKVFINDERSGLDLSFINRMVQHMGGPLPRMDIMFPRAQNLPFFLTVIPHRARTPQV